MEKHIWCLSICLLDYADNILFFLIPVFVGWGMHFISGNGGRTAQLSPVCCWVSPSSAALSHVPSLIVNSVEHQPCLAGVLWKYPSCTNGTLLQFVLSNWNFLPCWDLIAVFFFPWFVGWDLILRFADLMAFCCCFALAFSQWSASVLVCNRDWHVYKLFKIRTGSENGEQKAAVSLKSAVWSEHQLHPLRTKAILICGARESLTYMIRLCSCMCKPVKCSFV